MRFGGDPDVGVLLVVVVMHDVVACLGIQLNPEGGHEDVVQDVELILPSDLECIGEEEGSIECIQVGVEESTDRSEHLHIEARNQDRSQIVDEGGQLQRLI